MYVWNGPIFINHKYNDQCVLQTAPSNIIPVITDLRVVLLDVSHTSEIIGHVKRCFCVTYQIFHTKEP